MSARIVAVALLALLALGLGACGGGGGGSEPPPNYPQAVEELTEDDFQAVGIPALPQAASSVSALPASRSASRSLDCLRAGVVEHSEAVAQHNLTLTGDGFITEVPEDTTSRIIAWAMFELPLPEGERLRSIWMDLGFPSELRVFAAVSNFSRNRWEPMRIAVDPSDPSGNTVYFSPGQRYNRSDGPGFLLLAVGHPGNGNMSGYTIKLEDILISSYDVACLSEGFETQTPGAVNWGDGIVDYIDEDDSASPVLLRQRFTNLQDGTSNTLLLLPQHLDLTGAGGMDWFFFQSLSVTEWGGELIDTCHFYDPEELNGPRHPYNLTINGMGGNDTIQVNAVAMQVPPGGNEPNAIIAILIGLLGQPLGGVNVELRDSQGVVQRTALTNAKGEFMLQSMENLPHETFSLNFARTGLAGLPSYGLTLMEEEGIFYARVGPDIHGN